MIIFPMAGLSSRFTRAGYSQPKWMLPLAGRPLLDWSLLSFESAFETEAFIIVYLDRPDVGKFVAERVATLGIRDAQLIPLSEPTRGQAETVMLGLEASASRDTEPLTIFNIDTIRPRYRHHPMQGACDGWLECFIGEGDHWSFVRPVAPHQDRVSQVMEKVRISPYCCTGLYTFRSAALFEKYYRRELGHPNGSELYVAPLYQMMIDDGLDIRYGIIGLEEIVFSGTPTEYEEARRNEGGLGLMFGLS